MRVPSAAWLVSALLASSCGKPAEAKQGPDALVLEVGGGQASLRQALIAAGCPVEQPIEQPPAPVDRPAPHEAEPSVPPPDEHVEPPPPAPAEPKVLVVALGRGETLIHLAKKYLGDGNRFREILAANGWTERDARRLQAGQEVRIPVDGATAPR